MQLSRTHLCSSIVLCPTRTGFPVGRGVGPVTFSLPMNVPFVDPKSSTNQASDWGNTRACREDE